jgi:hypothetical protein
LGGVAGTWEMHSNGGPCRSDLKLDDDDLARILIKIICPILNIISFLQPQLSADCCSLLTTADHILEQLFSVFPYLENLCTPTRSVLW